MSKEIQDLIEGLGHTFEEFKKTNDSRLEKVEKNEATSDLQAKQAQIDEALEKFEDRLEKAENAKSRPGLTADDSPLGDEYRKEWANFIRKGKESEIFVKSGTVGVDAEGGYLAPDIVDTAVYDMLRDNSPMRGLCDVMQIGRAAYKQIVNTHGMGSGWVGETAARPETDEPVLAEFAPSFGEIYANPMATQTLLDDSFVNIESWYASEIRDEFTEQENTAFTTGNGTNKPKGLLAYTTAATADASRAYGTMEHIATTGTVGALDATDDLVSLSESLKAGYMGNARWMFARSTLATLRKLKDNQGNYLWRPGLEAGAPATLLERPYTRNDDMPAVAANSLSVAFGDFRRGYKILDVRGIRSLRDPYTNKPYVGFYTTKRVGGGVRDSAAIKFLKTKAA